MQSFTDNANRAWTVEITLGHARKINALHKVCLLTADDVELRQLLDVPRGLDIVWLLIEAQAAREGIGREQFEAALTGETIQAAMVALWTAVGDFFRYEPTLVRRWLALIEAREAETTTNQSPEAATPGTTCSASPA